MPNAVIETTRDPDIKRFYVNDKGTLLYPLKVRHDSFFVRINRKAGLLVVKLEKASRPIITGELKEVLYRFVVDLARQTGGRVVHHNLNGAGHKEYSLIEQYAIGLDAINRAGWINDLVGYSDINVEIGMGGGEFLLNIASLSPKEAFLGIEISSSDFLKALRRFSNARLENVKGIFYDAKALLDRFKPNSVNRIFINFPEPWFKIRRLKHSVLTPLTALRMARMLKVGGRILVVTDNYAFAVGSCVVLNATEWLRSVSKHCIQINDEALHTRYEKKWKRYKRIIYRVEFEKAERSPEEEFQKVRFPLELPKRSLFDDRYLFKVLNIYRKPNAIDIVEIAAGESKNPQHAFFGLEGGRFYPIDQTRMVFNHDFVQAWSLAVRLC